MRGAKESAAVNTIMVLLKLAVLVLFIAIALTAFKSENLTPFMPMGIAGVGAAASSIFFSYIGIDAVSTAGEEAKDPRRTLPIAIVLSLLIVTALYILVAFSGLGAQPWTKFQGQEAGLAAILHDITGASWPSILLALGAIVSIFSVTLIVIYGQTRILFAMSHDGMLPKVFGTVHPRTLTPVFNTIVVSIFIALLAGLVPLDALIDLTSMGTLVAFATVSIGVVVLRRTQPSLPRGFRVPLYPITPILSVAFCLYLIQGLPLATFYLFGGMLVIAAIIYFAYSIHNSRLEAGDTPATDRRYA
jgi:basic amino acid/polyamine antiporter, APA family